jgi:hypothetical protein
VAGGASEEKPAAQRHHPSALGPEPSALPLVEAARTDLAERASNVLEGTSALPGELIELVLQGVPLGDARCRGYLARLSKAELDRLEALIKSTQRQQDVGESGGQLVPREAAERALERVTAAATTCLTNYPALAAAQLAQQGVPQHIIAQVVKACEEAADHALAAAREELAGARATSDER